MSTLLNTWVDQWRWGHHHGITPKGRGPSMTTQRQVCLKETRFREEPWWKRVYRSKNDGETFSRYTKWPVVAAVCFSFGGEAVSNSIMHFTEEVQIPVVSPTPMQKIAVLSPELKAVLPKIGAHCIFVALLGELHRHDRVVVWPQPFAVQGANCLGLLVVDGVAEIRHRIFCAGPASLFARNTFCKAPVGFPLKPRGLAEVVHFKARLAASRKVLVVVNLRKDQDTTPFLGMCRRAATHPQRHRFAWFRRARTRTPSARRVRGREAPPNRSSGFRNSSPCSAPRRSRGPPRALATNSCGPQKRRRRQTRRTCPAHRPAPAVSYPGNSDRTMHSTRKFDRKCWYACGPS